MSISENIKIAQVILESKYHQLQVINELSCAFQSVYSNEEVFALYLQCLRSVLKVNRVYIIYQNEGWENIYSYNVIGNIPISLLVQRYFSTTQPELIQLNSPFLSQFDVVVPIIKSNAPLAYVFIGGIQQYNYESFSELVEFLQSLTNIALTFVENNFLYKRQMDKDLMVKDLGIAAEVQTMLIAKNLPNNQYIEIDAYYQPIQMIGGDYYDYIKLNDNEFAFCIADIAGKGIAAALLMANFQSTLRILIKQNIPPDKFIAILNNHVFDNTEGERYLTLFVAKYDIPNRRLIYINAGHIPPILFQNKQFEFLQTGTTMLGAFEKLPHFQLGELTLAPNAQLFCYTDGLSEMGSDNEETFKSSQLLEMMREYNTDSCRQFNSRIVAKFKCFKGNRHAQDDICFMNLRFK